MNPRTVPLLGYPKVIPCTKFAADSGYTNKQTDRQTDIQTDSKILPTQTGIVGVSNRLPRRRATLYNTIQRALHSII